MRREDCEMGALVVGKVWALISALGFVPFFYFWMASGAFVVFVFANFWAEVCSMFFNT